MKNIAFTSGKMPRVELAGYQYLALRAIAVVLGFGFAALPAAKRLNVDYKIKEIQPLPPKKMPATWVAGIPYQAAGPSTLGCAACL